MGKSKKPFIDRKKSVSFHLVHRSQRDPLITDEQAPQHVLIETSIRQPQKHQHSESTSVDVEKRKEEQRKYGIHFDDDYDYLQHLKKSEQEVVWEYLENPNQTRKRMQENGETTSTKLFLPSSVFASEFEEDVGMLNKAAPHYGPRLDWDPDIVAALDDDFDFNNEDNQLEDDFILKAMADNDEKNCDYTSSNEENSDIDSCDLDVESDKDINDGEMMDRLAPLIGKERFDKEETRSRFTEYSMSSSVIRRNEQLTLLDDCFERFYATYDDMELGDLATEEIQGPWNQKHPYLISCMEEFKKSKKTIEYDKMWDVERLEKYRYIDEDNDKSMIDEVIESERPKSKDWDCESIISTYSNVHNRPKILDDSINSNKRGASKIVIDTKTGIPRNVLRGKNELTEKVLAQFHNREIDKSGPKSLCEKSLISTLSVLSIRPKDETLEEKRERKRLVKEYRQERRIERKANTAAFKEEKKRLIQVRMNQRFNQQGSRLV